MISIKEQSAIIRARAKLPVEMFGRTWYPTVIAAEMSHYSTHALQGWALGQTTPNVILIATNGAQFIRIPRGPDDLRIPIYWDVDTLSRLK